MAKKIDPKKVEAALARVTDESSFIQDLLIDLLDWPIDPSVKTVEEIAYDWTKDDLKPPTSTRRSSTGHIRQLVLARLPVGHLHRRVQEPRRIHQSGRGMTVPLRQILSGLVPKQKKSAHLPSFFREHLLFICTCTITSISASSISKTPAPSSSSRRSPVSAGGRAIRPRPSAPYNLPHLAFLDDTATVDDWIADMDRGVRCRARHQEVLHRLQRDSQSFRRTAAETFPHANDRPWLASVVLNRLMFVYFLQQQGFLDGGKRVTTSKTSSPPPTSSARTTSTTDFLSLLFFEGFAKPEEKRCRGRKEVSARSATSTAASSSNTRSSRRRARPASRLDWPDSVFRRRVQSLRLLLLEPQRQVPGGEDNEINPDVLGYILEKYVNQKAFGAYYTRPEITGYLCERTIHRLILDAVNTPEAHHRIGEEGRPARPLIQVRRRPAQEARSALATKLLDDVLPALSAARSRLRLRRVPRRGDEDAHRRLRRRLRLDPFHGSPALKARLTKIRGRPRLARLLHQAAHHHRQPVRRGPHGRGRRNRPPAPVPRPRRQRQHGRGTRAAPQHRLQRHARQLA